MAARRMPVFAAHLSREGDMADRQQTGSTGRKLGESESPDNETKNPSTADTIKETNVDTNTNDLSGDRSSKGTGTRDAPNSNRGTSK